MLPLLLLQQLLAKWQFIEGRMQDAYPFALFGKVNFRSQQDFHRLLQLKDIQFVNILKKLANSVLEEGLFALVLVEITNRQVLYQI